MHTSCQCPLHSHLATSVSLFSVLQHINMLHRNAIPKYFAAPSITDGLSCSIAKVTLASAPSSSGKCLQSMIAEFCTVPSCFPRFRKLQRMLHNWHCNAPNHIFPSLFFKHRTVSSHNTDTMRVQINSAGAMRGAPCTSVSCACAGALQKAAPSTPQVLGAHHGPLCPLVMP